MHQCTIKEVAEGGFGFDWHVPVIKHCVLHADYTTGQYRSLPIY